MQNPLLSLMCTIAVFTLVGCSAVNENNKSSVTTDKLNVTEQASTFARFVPERKDDFAWENDLIAFRAYGPALRNGAENAGVDCWLKRVEKPIINLWYERSGKGISYHEDNGEGLDNYHVGSSAGCGSTSLWLNDKRVPLETYTRWKILEQSVDKTVFVLSYENQIDGKIYAEEKEISIELGSRLYHVTSTFSVNGKIAADLLVTVGLATHDEKASVTQNQKNGWLSAWETIGGFGLGTSVIVDPTRIEATKIIQSNNVKDTGHALFVLKTDKNGQIEYSSGYGWEKAGVITTDAKWHEYLNAYNHNH